MLYPYSHFTVISFCLEGSLLDRQLLLSPLPVQKELHVGSVPGGCTLQPKKSHKNTGKGKLALAPLNHFVGSNAMEQTLFFVSRL